MFGDLDKEGKLFYLIYFLKKHLKDIKQNLMISYIFFFVFEEVAFPKSKSIDSSMSVSSITNDDNSQLDTDVY